MDKEDIILFDEKKNCCYCTACKNICPKNAIDMYLDEYGFEYPKINKEKCILCGLCKRVCAFQNIKEENTPIETYVGVAKDKDIILKSASGGIFSTIAQIYLEKGGIVFGAAFDNNFNLIHIPIKDSKELYKLQGSKYVQSNTLKTYKEVKKLLKEGKEVLYSGTPCQIAGLKGYLMENYSNLLTIDIICHGVPSSKFFKDYIEILKRKLKGEIVDFKFRDKEVSWEKNGSVKYNIKGIIKKKRIYASESSYYYYFSKCDCFRESCYNCKYTSENRPGDITLGDYWGIEKVHPELLEKEKIREENGISVIIVNTIKGKEVIESSDKFYRFVSSFSKARIKNEQLNSPSKKGENYKKVMNLYKNYGYLAVESLYNKQVGIRKYKSRIKTFIPSNIKRYLKKYI